jgi:IclR family transcriptional regulator, acetate operon repressor
VAVTPQAEGPRYPIGAVDRALRLLLMFRERPELRIVDAARELEAAPSTVHRILAMLMAYGFVSKDADTQTYLPGEVLVDLGVQVVNQWDFVETARPVVADLAVAAGETVSLGVLRQSDVLVVAAAESEQIVRIAGQLGQRIPAFHSAMGRTLLAELPVERVRRMYPDQTLVGQGRSAGIVIERDELEAELARVREQGYATNDLPRSMDYASVAVPVRRHGRAIAAMALAIPRQRVTPQFPQRLLRELRHFAAALEDMLTENRPSAAS